MSKVLVTGASGLIGSHLSSFWENKGHHVLKLRRKASGDFPPGPSELYVDLCQGIFPYETFENTDVVAHFAGENVGKQRWTKAYKQKMWDSRVLGTKRLVEGLQKLSNPPKVLLSASAVGVYGDCGNEIIDEERSPGTGFLSDLGALWEQEALAMSNVGTRVVLLRIGVVITPYGGAIKRMKPTFLCCMGGAIGSGKQYVSWIDLEDLIPAIDFLAFDSTLEGAVNISSPNPVTSAQWANLLGRSLGRPASMNLPSWLARGCFGEFSDVLLSSQRTSSKKLQDAGFDFKYPDMENSLNHYFKKE
jgi:uncharacterized protein